ncbi:MAG TPA: DUF1192 domain-containing protein [Caulobacteraceae bacterium]
MSEEPAEARRVRGQLLIDFGREDLDLFGIEELKERIALLEVEIGRVQAQLDKKQASRAAADALFGRRD